MCQTLGDLSSSVKLFLQVNYLKITTTFNKTLIFETKPEQSTSPETILLHIYPPHSYFDDTIQTMFNLSDQIFEAVCNPFYKWSDKQHEILKQLIVLKLSESYKHIDTNLQ